MLSSRVERGMEDEFLLDVQPSPWMSWALLLLILFDVLDPVTVRFSASSSWEELLDALLFLELTSSWNWCFCLEAFVGDGELDDGLDMTNR